MMPLKIKVGVVLYYLIFSSLYRIYRNCRTTTPAFGFVPYPNLFCRWLMFYLLFVFIYIYNIISISNEVRVTLAMYQKLLTLPVHLISPLIFVGFVLLDLQFSMQYFVYDCLSFFPFSFNYCIVCPSLTHGF